VCSSDLAAADIPMAIVSGATFSTVQQMQDIFHSAGWTSGGGITDDADGTITVATGTGLIRATDSATAEILFTDWPAESGANVALVDGSISYIYAEYNAGSPRVIATTTERTDYNTNILLGLIYRTGTALHINVVDMHIVGDHANSMIRRLKEIQAYPQVDGGIISETGTRNIAFTAGSFWQGLTEFTTPAFDTSASDTFSYFYRDGVGGFTEVVSQTAISNTQYDDGTGSLATLSNNKYGVHWSYLNTDGDLLVLYGRGNYSLSQAVDAQPPATLPKHIIVHGFLAGKTIIEEDATVFSQIESAFQTVFTGSLAQEHGNLIGLAGDDHPQYALLASAQTIVGNWVNTANPWADNEVADNITLTNLSQVSDADSATQTLTNKTLNTASNTIVVVEADISDLSHLATSITDGLIIEPDLNTDVVAVDGDYLQYDSTGTNFTWRSASEVLSDIGAEGTLTNEAGLYAALSDVTDFLQSLLDDASPQLAGFLDTNGNDIALDDATGIDDENGNQQVIFQTTASAVNEIEITNAATANAPQIAATGGDTNIDLKLQGKGTGAVKGHQQHICVAISDETTAITTGTGKFTIRMPYAFTLTEVRGSLNTVSSSGSPIFDIHESGTTIMTTNKILIDVSEKTSETATTAPTLTDTSLADDAEITFDIDTAGTGAKGAKICMIGHQ